MSNLVSGFKRSLSHESYYVLCTEKCVKLVLKANFFLKAFDTIAQRLVIYFWSKTAVNTICRQQPSGSFDLWA